MRIFLTPMSGFLLSGFVSAQLASPEAPSGAKPEKISPSWLSTWQQGRGIVLIANVPIKRILMRLLPITLVAALSVAACGQSQVQQSKPQRPAHDENLSTILEYIHSGWD